MNFRDRVVSELARLDLMTDRVPFTHHHDYVRANAVEARFMSRADVAQLSASEDELYSCAFLQAVEGLTTKQKITYDVSKSIFYQCSNIALRHMVDIDKHLKAETRLGDNL